MEKFRTNQRSTDIYPPILGETLSTRLAIDIAKIFALESYYPKPKLFALYLVSQRIQVKFDFIFSNSYDSSKLLYVC